MQTASRPAPTDATLLRRELRADGVLTLTLARPQARNALSIAMLDALVMPRSDQLVPAREGRTNGQATLFEGALCFLEGEGDKGDVEGG